MAAALIRALFIQLVSNSNFILRHWRQKMSTEEEKQTACYLCGVRKPQWYMLLVDFQEPVCRACCNYEGSHEKIVNEIERAKKMKRLQNNQREDYPIAETEVGRAGSTELCMHTRTHH